MKKCLTVLMFVLLATFTGAEAVSADRNSNHATAWQKKSMRDAAREERRALREALRNQLANLHESLKDNSGNNSNGNPAPEDNSNNNDNNNSNNNSNDNENNSNNTDNTDSPAKQEEEPEKEKIQTESINLTELFKASADDASVAWPSAYKEATPVKFKKDLLSSSKAPAILSLAGTSINFEIDGETYVLSERDTYRNRSGYSWFGKVSGARFLSHFAVVGDAVSGEIWLPDGEHRSIVSRGGEQYLVKWNDSKLRSLVGGDMLVGRDSFRALPNVASQEEEADATARLGRRRAVRSASPPACAGDTIENIDQLIIYTPQAVAWFGAGSEALDALKAAAQNSVDATNATIINSTRKWNYRLNLVGLVEVDRSYDDGDLNRIFNTVEVNNLMDARNADSLFLMTGDYSYAPGALFGYGASRSFVGYPAWTFVHENGHAIWQMQHNPDNEGAPDARLPGWAYDHYVDGVARGTMAYGDKCSKGCPVQPVFANPDIMYPDTRVPSGIEGERENWRMLEYRKGTISKFRIAGNESKCTAN